MDEAQFSRLVVARARRERPDIRVKAMGKFLLMVEAEVGRRRMVSLVSLYQSYTAVPVELDELLGVFLTAMVYEEPGRVKGTYAENRHKVMPQVVPPSLLAFCKQDQRELAAVDYVGGLSIAFVIDEPERYSYIHRTVVDTWGISVQDLLKEALTNLRSHHEQEGAFYQIGRGDRTALVWETFDGYDASRILLSQELNEMAAQVVGTPLIAIPHRDYLVMIGNTNAEFVTEMAERMREDFEAHSYPISGRFFTLIDGILMPADALAHVERFLN
jgi:uncharacterized protein YtpQ (UPF0354 family)